MIFSPQEVTDKGLEYCGARNTVKMTHKGKVNCFKAHYGSHPLVLCRIWEDLHSVGIEKARLTQSERDEKSFKQFLISHYFMWTKPKNAEIVSSHFDVNRREAQGKTVS